MTSSKMKKRKNKRKKFLSNKTESRKAGEDRKSLNKPMG